MRSWCRPGFGSRSKWRLQHLAAACKAEPSKASKPDVGLKKPRDTSSPFLFCFPLDPDGVRPPRRRDEGDHPWREPGPGFLRDRPRGAGCWGAVHTPARAVHRRRTVSGLQNLARPHPWVPRAGQPAQSPFPNLQQTRGRPITHPNPRRQLSTPSSPCRPAGRDLEVDGAWKGARTIPTPEGDEVLGCSLREGLRSPLSFPEVFCFLPHLPHRDSCFGKQLFLMSTLLLMLSLSAPSAPHRT